MSDPLLGQTQPPAADPQTTGAYAPAESALALAQILDQYLADLQAGRAPNASALLAAHPELADQLRQCLSGIDFVHRVSHASGETPAQLGDFRIVREVGRGGMGVVYEAEQVSLHRRVALKVLRFAGVADAEAMQRFQREAETVGRLHHTNIVPIFAVGCEQGVQYYAMQFIEGRGLDAVLAQAGTALDPHEVARLGLQAAEALAHAHQRGVIHRDIKPSNLLLDGEGCLWLTDFGLAKRLDEVTLTATGMLMGTPRYMSPEQAAAMHAPIDHRTDVYSLGATLYELATGKPVFDATTPQAVLSQILTAEPVAPSRLQRQLPRDLETIVLKCLAKEPARRYESAQALAHDLRAFHEGRPIRARRPSFVERAARWLKQNRRSAVLVGITAALAVLITIAGLIGLEEYRQWQTGRLVLLNDGPVLTGEILNEDGSAVQPRFTVPTEAPLVLPAGTYQLRLRGRGFLDEITQVQIERGKELVFEVSLNEQRLWKPLAVERSYDCVRIGERHDVLSLSATGVSRVHGGTGEVLWTARLGEKDHPALAGFRWDWDIHATPSGRGDKDRRPILLQPAPDLDGDGIPDLVWMSRRQAAVLALSGKDGKVLWCWKGPAPRLAPDSRFHQESACSGLVLGIAVVPDGEGPGIPVLVVTCASQEQGDQSVPRWVEALSGGTGKSLWRYDLAPDWFTPPQGSPVPLAALWNNTQGVGSESSTRHLSGFDMLYEKDWGRPSGGLTVPYPAEVVHLGKPAIVLAAGTRLVGLDPRTGQPLWPAHDLGFWPLRAPQFADLDGDGQMDVLLLGLGEEARKENPGEGGFVPDDPDRFLPPMFVNQPGAQERTDDRLKLTALTLTTRRPMWERPFRGYWGWNWFQEPFTWPLIEDLDGDGKRQVIVPAGDFEGETKWSGVQVCEGATGEVRWLRKLSRSSQFGQVQQINRILVGDRPGRGSRTVFTAVLDGEFFPRDRPFSSFRVGNIDKDYAHPVLLLDALSGKDGHGIWWTRQRVGLSALITSPKPSVGRLHWWHGGADGWPQLVVPYVPGSPQQRDARYPVYFVSSRSGKVEHVGADYPEVRTLDLDGDGMLDLLAFRPSTPDALDSGGRLETLRGRSPEAWRRRGGWWQPAGDLDGDGIPDLITAQPNDERDREALRPREREDSSDLPDTVWGQTQAISGRTGRVIWQRTINDAQKHTPWEQSMYTRLQPLGPGGDLDGDGVPDLLATGRSNCIFSREGTFPPLLAVSGKTGRRLWETDLAVELWAGPQVLECRDLDRDGKPEIVFVSAMDEGRGRKADGTRSSNDWQYWLAVLSGSDGKVRWKQPLSEGEHRLQPAQTPFACVLADLDGDGVLDVIVEAGSPDKDGEVRAYSGKDGTLLWRWQPEQRPGEDGRFGINRPTLAVGSLDGGKPDVLVLHTFSMRDAKGLARNHVEVLALDGASGQPKWQWREHVDPDYNSTSNSAVRSRVTPLIVRLDRERRAVCVWTYDYEKKGQIVLLDGHGKELKRLPVKFRLGGDAWKRYRDDPRDQYAPFYGGLFRVWAVDLHGSGRDDLVYFASDRLRMLSGDLTGSLGEWRLPDEDCDMMEVRPPGDFHPALLVVRAGGHVVFLDKTIETPVWTCAGSGKPPAVLWEARKPPRVFYELGNEVTACRVAQPGSADASGFGLAPPALERDDPRFVQPLPWYPLGDLPPLMPSSPAGLALSLLGISLLVLVLPGAFLLWVVRRRAWLLVPVPLIWLALVWAGACFLFLARLEDEARWQIYNVGEMGFAWRLGKSLALRALAGLPLAAFLAVAWVWLRRRLWGRLAALLLLALALAALVGVVWMRSYAEPLGPEQHYSYRGWYAIWPAGLYAAGVMVLAGVILVSSEGLVRRAVLRFRVKGE
jgi:tRNA A-37 threonylcarbamoyl transferase component Bud32/outer membrane protein assembly factor BamB